MKQESAWWQRHRKAFELWISASPFEKDVGRFPNDETKYGWPNSYKDLAVDLAWLSWMEAAEYIESSKPNE